MIVLIPRKDGYLLNTAYPVIFPNKIREIEKKANDRGNFACNSVYEKIRNNA